MFLIKNEIVFPTHYLKKNNSIAGKIIFQKLKSHDMLNSLLRTHF